MAQATITHNWNTIPEFYAWVAFDTSNRSVRYSSLLRLAAMFCKPLMPITILLGVYFTLLILRHNTSGSLATYTLGQDQAILHYSSFTRYRLGRSVSQNVCPLYKPPFPFICPNGIGIVTEIDWQAGILCRWIVVLRYEIRTGIHRCRSSRSVGCLPSSYTQLGE
jgi:hypothetical protein